MQKVDSDIHISTLTLVVTHSPHTHSALVVAQQMTLGCPAAIYRRERGKKWEGKIPSPPSLRLHLSLLSSPQASAKVMEDGEKRETPRKRMPETNKREGQWQRKKKKQKHRQCALIWHFVLCVSLLLQFYFQKQMNLFNSKQFLFCIVIYLGHQGVFLELS